MTRNIKKAQIRELFNDFINMICYGVWLSGIEGSGKYRRWFINKDLVFEIEFKNSELIKINYINLKYKNYRDWFNYWDEDKRYRVDFYHKIKEMYNNGKYKRTTN